MYLGIYFAFGVGSAALVVLQTLILWIFCSIEVSTDIHALQLQRRNNHSGGCREPPQANRTDQWLMRLLWGITGIPQITREDGVCDIQIANELL